MTLATRIIPCLDVDNGRVVKGVNFQDLKDAGLAPGNVYNCVNGKRKTTGGQTWRRV